MPPFEPVAKQPDHIGLEHRVLDRWAHERTFETLRDRNRGGPRFSFFDGPITANNPMGVHHGLGSDAEGHLAALPRDAGLRPALPERLRLPGPLGRGGGREGAWAELQARDRGVRARPLRARLPRSRRPLRGRAHRALQAARPVDGLGPVVLHDDRPQHQLHLGVPQALSRARMAVPRPPLDAVVPPLRHVADASTS